MIPTINKFLKPSLLQCKNLFNNIKFLQLIIEEGFSFNIGPNLSRHALKIFKQKFTNCLESNNNAYKIIIN
jgi:hypothetical protein